MIAIRNGEVLTADGWIKADVLVADGRIAALADAGVAASQIEEVVLVGGSTRIPLVYSNPRLFPKAQSSDALVSHVDFLPTLASLVEEHPHELLIIRQMVEQTLDHQVLLEPRCAGDASEIDLRRAAHRNQRQKLVLSELLSYQFAVCGRAEHVNRIPRLFYKRKTPPNAGVSSCAVRRVYAPPMRGAFRLRLRGFPLPSSCPSHRRQRRTCRSGPGCAFAQP